MIFVEARLKEEILGRLSEDSTIFEDVVAPTAYLLSLLGTSTNKRVT